MSGNAPTLIPPKSAPVSRALSAVAPAASTGRPQILLATVNRPEGQTGVHTHTRVLQEGLAAAGISCTVESPFSRGPHWLPIFAIRRVFGAMNKSWSTRWYRRWHRAALLDNLLKRLKEAPFSGVILAQCPISADAAMEARRQIGLSQPVAMVCHFNYSEAQEYRDKGELGDEASFQEILDFEKRVLGQVDRVIYVSRWAKQVVEETRGIRTRSSSVIWNGVPRTATTAVSRQSLGLQADDAVLINVGTLEPRKNQLGLIDLFELVAQQEPRARLVLVGEGPARAAIEKKLNDKSLSTKATLLGHRTDVAALLGAADVYVHYSSLENCPVVLLEAARAGLPVAAIPAGGVPELLDSLGGIPLDLHDLNRSLESLRPLLLDANARRALGDAARKSFDRSFTREAMVNAYLAALGLAGAEGQ
jgi:glycosyltransferase involved in cell wall biosynthesis